MSRLPARLLGLGLGVGVVLLAGCRERRQTADEARPVAEESAQGPGERSDSDEEELDPDRARKRACVERLTADAAPRLHALLRSLCAEWVERDVPGLALAIIEPGAAPVQVELGVRCFGQRGEGVEVEAGTRFRLGSVSKPVTAALALGLVASDEGLSRASEATMVPNFATQAGLPPPQLEALLRHRSGLGEIEPELLVELDGAWLPALAQSEAAGRPGEYHYSNAGYSLVGAMLEAASGQPYAALVRERIAAPLGLTSLTADSDVPASACGHLADDPDRHPIPIREDLEFMPGDPTWMTPAGGLLSSATDLARFALELGGERLPGSAAVLELGEPLPPAQARPGHADERYGYGLRSWRLDGATRAYGHSGNNVAFAAELLFVPGERAIVILANVGVELPATLAAAEALLSG